MDPRPKQLSAVTNDGIVTGPQSVLIASSKPNWTGASPVRPEVAGGRLTVLADLGLPTTDLTNRTTLYYYTHTGSYIALFDGEIWRYHDIGVLSKDLTDTDAEDNPLTPDTTYDVFVFNDGTGAQMEFVKWNSVGPGADERLIELGTLDGVLVKSIDATRRYVGTFRTTSNASPIYTEDSAARRFVWSYTNQVMRSHVRQIPSIEAWNSFATTPFTPFGVVGDPIPEGKVEFVIGLPTACRFEVTAGAFTNATGSNNAAIAVGFNSDSTADINTIGVETQYLPVVSTYVSFYAISHAVRVAGYHYFQALWRSTITASSIGFSTGDGAPPGVCFTYSG